MKSGLILQNFKNSVRPQDDLFRFTNGAWLDSTEIPADRSWWGAPVELRELSEKRVKAIIDDLTSNPQPAGTNGQKIADLYQSFMNEAAIEAAGIDPIRADLEKSATINSREEFLAFMADLENRGTGGLFYGYISGDAKDVNTNIIHIGQSGIGLPDEAYYREEEFAEIRSAYISHVEKMLSIAGIDDAAGHAGRVMALETEIASHHWDQVKDRDANLTYNKYSLAELKSLTPNFDWDLYLSSGKVPAKVFAQAIVAEPSFFEGISSIFGKFEIEKWRSWLIWNIIHGSAAYLHAPLVEENFNLYGKILSGAPEIRARWKRAISLTEGGLGEAIGQIYVERHFPASAKIRMEELVANLIEAYRISISGLDWMTETTKVKALEKLSKFRSKIGYPDKWRDYSSLTIDGTDLIGNLARINAFSLAIEFAKIGNPVDRDLWLMFPQTVNAYYRPDLNEIVFPAAYLQPPFFDPEADDASNYAGVGSTIGHEIGHGFDDQGSKYDGDGFLQNWWSDEDLAEFEKRAAMLIQQFDGCFPEELPDLHVNGALTVGENIGDLGGVCIAYKAYQLALNGAEAPVIDGYTGAQRFFLAYGQSNKAKWRPEMLRTLITTDPHSPDEFRTNQIVKNVNEFYEAFDVKPTDALYLPPEERVRIW